MTVDITSQPQKLIWLTGLSGSGKSTIAQALARELTAKGQANYLLDGDILRQGLNSDLGYSEADRHENVRRTGEVCKLLLDAGLTVIAAFISPYRADRDAIRAKLMPGQFIEVFVDTPLEVCEQRDPKGLYKQARKGEIENFTGISAPYEPPQTPEFSIQTTETSVKRAVDTIIQSLEKAAS